MQKNDMVRLSIMYLEEKRESAMSAWSALHFLRRNPHRRALAPSGLLDFDVTRRLLVTLL